MKKLPLGAMQAFAKQAPLSTSQQEVLRHLGALAMVSQSPGTKLENLRVHSSAPVSYTHLTLPTTPYV